MASGLDTDTMIKQLMSIERAKVDRVRQDKTVLEWKRDDYRSISNSLRAFRDEYFDTLKPTTNFRSSSAFASYNTSSSNESIATVKAGVGAVSGTHTLYVKKLATAASIESSASVTGAVDGSVAITDFSLQGKQIDITLDGVRKTINLEDYADIGDLQTKLQAAIDGAFGKINATTSKLDVLVSGGKIELKTNLSGSTFKIADTANNYISSLGFASGQQNFIAGTDISSTSRSSLNGTFKVKLGSTEQEITLSGITDANTLDDVKTIIQNQVDASFGAGKIGVSLDGGKLEFVTKTGENLTLSSGSTDNNLAMLGINSGTTVTGTSSFDIDLSENEKGKTFTLNINGVDQTVEISNNYADMASLQSDIQSQLSGVTVGVSGNKLVFQSNSNEKIIFKQGPLDSVESLGFASTDNRGSGVSFSASLDSVEGQFAVPANFDGTANVQFSINGTSINLGKTFAQASINDVMTAINTSGAGVEMKYDSMKDKFTLTSKTTGSAETISITDANGLFSALGINQANLQAGEDAIFDLDGVTDMQRSTNEFEINGVTYSLKSDATPATAVTINVNGNADGLVDKIKGFVTKYNELLDKINGELSEKKERSYRPLTDEEKEAMKDSDITKWEEKAKSGLLSNDSVLSNIVNSMRKALTDDITGGSMTLANIGITSGSYDMKGKLVIDETKLKAAINENIDGVAQLFTKESDISYNDGLSDAAKRNTRYQESGLAQRLNDILQDNIRTNRDSNGKKGILLEKAGITGDITDVKNIMSDMISQKNKIIDTLLDRLIDKEDALYKKFTAMEKALSQMNSQTSWLSQQFGGSQ
jgi:flagellar hook-associated protein 2